MSATRRDVLKWGAFSGAALLLRIGPDAETAAAGGGSTFRPNQWLRIGADDSVTLIASRSEMGQGARTALPMILAEELEVDFAAVTVLHASPGKDFPRMRTSGSSAVAEEWRPLRLAGAAAREMLIAAAAERWGVEPASCRAEKGIVVHGRSARRARYGELVEAAAKMPVPKDPPLKDPKDFRIVGFPQKRVDGPRIVDGTAVYGLDVKVPGMKVATVVRPPVLGGKAASWDAGKARAVPGVREVIEVPTGVAVVADTTWQALKGREALNVIWTDGPYRAFDSAAHRRTLAAAAHERQHDGWSVGDARAAMASAPRRLEAVYEYAFQAHAPVEPMNCVAEVKPGSCEIWVGTQAPNEAQKKAAAMLGLSPDAVIVHVALLGGGFGRRLAIDYVEEAVEVARRVKGPVQVVWSRPDDMKHGYFHPASAHHLQAGLDENGRVLGFSHDVAGSYLTMFGPPDPREEDAWDSWGAYDNPYVLPAFSSGVHLLDSPVPSGAWRAVAYPPGTFARESFIDELAHASGKDPVAFRLGLLDGPRSQKIRSALHDRGALLDVVKLAAEKSGWGSPLPRGRARGFACNLYHGRTAIAQVAEVSVERGGVHVHRVVCVVDCGQVINPLGLVGQMESGIIWGLSAALKGEITIKEGRVQQTSYRDFPVIRLHEAPAVEVHIVKSGRRPSGAGEQPVPCVAPAVLNAVFTLTGKRIRRLPVVESDLA